jgi:hypothetical protein
MDSYIAMMEKVYQNRPKNHQENGAEEWVKLCEQAINETPKFIKSWEDEYHQFPIVLPAVDYYVEYLLANGAFDKAFEMVETSVKNYEIYYEQQITFIKKIKEIFEQIQKLLGNSQGMNKTELEETIKKEDIKIFDWYIKNTNSFKKRKNEGRMRVWLAHQSTEPVREKLYTDEEFRILGTGELKEWYVAVIFGVSKSKKYQSAIEIISKAKIQIDGKMKDGKFKHKAIFTSEKESFSLFQELFEYVKDWKNTEFVINDKLIDMKSVGEITACFGVKMLAKKENYCFGTQSSHKNPFGCHKLRLNNGNEPWWSFGHFDSGDVWHIDKRELLAQLKNRAKDTQFCPAFSWKKVMEVYENLPDTIDTNENPNWIRSGYTLQPLNDEEI